MRTTARMIPSVVLAIAFSFAPAPPAFGTDGRSTYWDRKPNEPGCWFMDSNWTLGVPGEHTWAYITNGGAAVVGGHNVPAQAGRLTIGGYSGGALDLHSGVLNVTGDTWLGWPSGNEIIIQIFPPPPILPATFDLSGGRFVTENGYISSGDPYYRPYDALAGRGSSFHQSGGHSEFTQSLNVGYATVQPIPLPSESSAADGDESLGPDSDSVCPPGARYTLSGGTLTAPRVFVGDRGRGEFVQTLGANIETSLARIGALYVGGGGGYIAYPLLTDAAAPAVDDPSVYPAAQQGGAYSLIEGRLEAEVVHVGHNGYGAIRQSGGHAVVEGRLQVGADGWWCNTDPAAPLEDTSVTAPVYSLAHGDYTLTGGDLITGGTDVGFAGSGRFVQSGPSAHHVNGALRIGGGAPTTIIPFDDAAGDSLDPVGVPFPTPASGSYAISDGVLTARRLELGPGATGSWAPYSQSTFTQTGGEVRIGDVVSIAGDNATYAMTAGSLSASGLHVGRPITDANCVAPGNRLELGGRAKVNVTRALLFDGDAAYEAHDATIRMTGADFGNHSTSSKHLGGLASTTMVFTIGPEDDQAFETFEVAGKDLGFSRAGFWNNFVLDALVIGDNHEVGEVQLQDRFDNQPGWDGREALYVHRLVIGPGGRLDLNGLNLYYLSGAIADDAHVAHGALQRCSPAEAGLTLGDSNFDGAVDLADFVALKNHFGSADAHWGKGDFNDDGVVDLADFVALKSNFGRGSVVPEPGTTVLMLLAAAGVVRRRR